MTYSDDTPVPDYFARLRLDGRPFVVLGAGQGIGRQTTHALSQAGASLLCVDNDERRAQEIAREVGGVPCVADIRDREQVERVVSEATAAFGSIHGIVDIVGAARYSKFVATTDAEWEWTFDMVLRHAFLVAQVGGRAIADGGGGVLAFVASISGLTSSPMHAAYGAAKAALMSLVRSVAVELGPRGVRVNAVAPGGTLTPRMLEVLSPDERESMAQLVPSRRLSEPSDIAGGLLFVVSDLAANVTGQVLVVDGGGHIAYPYPVDQLDG
ncbi:MAG TPA: SDR family oxidoreductase [Acidimicrobiales bacterium]|nr:SDR family oxidoreductase [Acidimicrobiales bacterium]